MTTLVAEFSSFDATAWEQAVKCCAVNNEFAHPSDEVSQPRYRLYRRRGAGTR